MVWLLTVAVLAVVLVAARPVLRWRDRRLQAWAETIAVRLLVDEDLSLLGVLLDEVERHLTGYALDGTSKAEHQQARDTYEAAKAAVAGLRTGEQAKDLAEKVCEGRYALERLRARLADQPVPARKTPCFFDPRHGPAGQDVLWTRPAHGSHMVPACAADAARVASGEQPPIRTVEVRGRTVPYWDAGAPSFGYCNGCFADTVAFLAAPAARRSSVDPSTRSYDIPGLVLPPTVPGRGGSSGVGYVSGFGGGGCGGSGGGGGSC